MIKISQYCHTYLLKKISKIPTCILVVAVVVAVSFLFAGNALSDDLQHIRISPFKAHYYTENDGKNPGNGNDGTIKDIVSKLRFTETVKRPSLNYSYSDFHGINSYNFYGVWEGTIHAVGEGQSVKARFDVSKGDVSLYVNDNLVDRWRDESKIVQFNLNKSDNKIRIELHNHWHTTTFNVSFTNYQKLNKSAALELINNIDFNSTKVVYIGMYSARSSTLGDNYNEILVTLPKSSAPIFVFLNSYRAINWVISNPHNAKIVGIALHGHSPGSTAATTTPAPIYEFPASTNAYKNSYGIRAFIGRNADYALTKYSGNSIIVPDFFQSGINDYSNGNRLDRSSGASRPEQTDDKYPVNSFIESLVVQRQNSRVIQGRVVREPAFEGVFTKGSWKGYFDVAKPTDKSFKISHQGIKGELIIDGRSVWQGENTGEKTYQHTFSPGRHEVMFMACPEIESRPVKFHVSITDNAKDLKYNELASYLKGLGNFDSMYCGVEKGKSADQRVDIVLNVLGQPVVLFLTSYKNTIWDFKNCNTDKIAAIVTSAKSPANSIKNLPSHIPVYPFFRLSNTTQLIPIYGRRSIKNTFKNAALQILALTGKLPVGFSGARQTDTISIPEIILDRKKYRAIGFTDVSADYNVFIEHPQKIDVVFNPVTTKLIEQNSTSEFTRARQIKPEVQRKSWAESLDATDDIPTDAFKVYYFDIFNPGQPKFSGIVEDVSINSSMGIHVNSTGTAVDQNGIIPANFGAFWLGNIALNEDKEMEINIDSSNAITRVLIDNKVVKDRKISLKKGLHKIEIEYVNNSSTYRFSFSLDEPQTLLAYEDLKEQLKNILPKKIHTAYVGVYDSKSNDNSITLDIKNVGKPIFLILASFHAVNWVIDGPGAKDVKALLISSTRSKSKIKGNVNQGIPKFYFPMSSHTYQLESKCECQGGGYSCTRDLFTMMDYIETITGRKINSFTGNYDAKSFLVPETDIDKKQFKILKKEAKDNLLAQSKCEGPKFTPQYLKRKQRKQITEQNSAQQALKYMKSILDNKFEEFIQFMGPRQRKSKADGIKQRFLLQHNYFAGYDPSIAYHLIDKKMYEKIVTNTTKLTIPLVLKRKDLKDYYINIHMNKVRGRWVVSRMEYH